MSYKQWSEAERNASFRKTKKAIADGDIPPAKVLGCNRCKQTKGVIDYHNHNYDHPTKYLEALCYTCHMVHHNFHNNPQGCMDYWDRVFQGYQPEPQFDRNQFYKVMYREGIFKRKKK